MFEYTEKINSLNKKLKKIAGEGAYFISREDLYCNFDSKVCDIFTDGGLLIVWDSAHLNTFGAKYLDANLIINPYAKIFGAQVNTISFLAC